jgi:hypothetical protein
MKNFFHLSGDAQTRAGHASVGTATRRFLAAAVFLGPLHVIQARPFTAQTQTKPATGRARLGGYVGDSLHGKPLTNATVVVAGLDRRGKTNAKGQFMIDSLPAGEYALEVLHPMLDTLGLKLVTRHLRTSDDSVTIAVLAVPSARTLTGRLCPANEREGGAIFGRILDADDDKPVTDAMVTVNWRSLKWDKTLEFTPYSKTIGVGSDGYYALCGLPKQLIASLQVTRGDAIAGPVQVAYDSGGVGLQSLRIGTAVAFPESSTVAADSAPKKTTQALRVGDATLTGWVVAGDNWGVDQVRLSVVGAEAIATTRADGKFTLNHLPTGTQVLVVRRIGYVPVTRVVDLSRKGPNEIVVNVGGGIPLLTSVEVAAEGNKKGLEHSGFFKRQKSTAGHFVTAQDIRMRPIMNFTDIFIKMPIPSITAFRDVRGNAMYRDRRGGPNQCVNIYLDHTLQRGLLPGDLDLIVQPDDVAGIEIYTRATTPSEFIPLRVTEQDLVSDDAPVSIDGTQRGMANRSDCATIVVWTKFMMRQR